jgi:hypothetical protein
MNYAQARKHVEAVKGYYIHLIMYFSVIIGLFLVDYLQGGGWWFYWVAFGWGIGVIGHTLAMIFEEGPWGRQWEERKIEELMHRV